MIVKLMLYFDDDNSRIVRIVIAKNIIELQEVAGHDFTRERLVYNL